MTFVTRFALAATIAATLAYTSLAHADAFTTRASMKQARFGHTATVLSNGKVLVVGGGTIDSTLKTAELYDPIANTWTFTGSLTVAREYHTATLLTNGKVLVVGGSDAGVPLQSAELFDPATGVWSKAGTPLSKRDRATAILLPSGNVLLALGFTGNNQTGASASGELYNPSTNAWSSANSTTGQNARGFALATIPPGSVDAVFYGGADGGGHPLATGAGYNFSINSWTGPWPLMSTARELFTFTLLPSGSTLAAGGYGNAQLSSAELYSSGGSWSPAASMNVARYAHTATVLNADGDVLVAGGVTTDTSLVSAEVYSSLGNSWTPTGKPMSVGRAQHTAVPLGTGRVLLCGGQTGTGGTAVETDSCELYAVDPIFSAGFEPDK